MFTLLPLPYDYKALESVIDEQTMKIHHGKHHQAYVNNLNIALEKENYTGSDLHELLHYIDQFSDSNRQAIINNAGGHFNHTMFWHLMQPGGNPQGLTVVEKIVSTFGSIEALQDKMSTVGLARFGSGWVWLIEENGELKVTSTANQDNPIMYGQKPLIGIDVWEHAYYLRYQNLRTDYLKAWWQLCNWEEVEKNYLTKDFLHLFS